MQERDVIRDTEEALQRLMPVGLSAGLQEGLEECFDELAGESKMDFYAVAKRIAAIGAVAVLVAGLVLGMIKIQTPGDRLAGLDEAEPDVVFLEELDRVEDVSDEGLYVDAGGSAVRKLRVRVVEESRIRDEETGIVVDLSAPREETYLVPISTF